MTTDTSCDRVMPCASRPWRIDTGCCGTVKDVIGTSRCSDLAGKSLLSVSIGRCDVPASALKFSTNLLSAEDVNDTHDEVT